eukprot:GHVQ01030134.1.p1 GENE.GHVQ01030134.1~~GHVQ01030134.1.p1  ORF type:complete len:352 (-),score=26.53 GHVQ01030134.1:215-1228(-)
MLYPIFLILLVILSHSISLTHHTHLLFPIGFIPTEAGPILSIIMKSGGCGCRRTASGDDIELGSVSETYPLPLSTGSSSDPVLEMLGGTCTLSTEVANSDSEHRKEVMVGRTFEVSVPSSVDSKGSPETLSVEGNAIDKLLQSILEYIRSEDSGRTSNVSVPSSVDSKGSPETLSVEGNAPNGRLQLIYDQLRSKASEIVLNDTQSVATRLLACIVPPSTCECAILSGDLASFIGVKVGDRRTELPRLTDDVVLRLAAILLEMSGLNKQRTDDYTNDDDVKNLGGCKLNWETEKSTFSQDLKVVFANINLTEHNGQTRPVFSVLCLNDQYIQGENSL